MHTHVPQNIKSRSISKKSWFTTIRLNIKTKFINEISYLERKNLLVWRYGLNMGEMGRAYIIYKGNKIGEFLSIEYQRNMIIDKICEK